MTRRNKQIAYGSFYLVLWVAIIYGFYAATLKPPASCFDNKLNQDEVEVDCGGAFCESCAIRHLSPLRVTGVTLVPAGTENTTSALVEMQNPNSAYGALSFHYRIEFWSAASTSLYVAEGDSFIYPSEVKQMALVSLPFSPSAAVSRSESISAIVWKSLEALSVPKLQTRDVKLVFENGRVLITGILRNNSIFPLLTAAVNGYVQDSSQKIIGVSRTTLQDVVPNEERFFQIVVPLPVGADQATLQPRVSVEAKR